MVGAYDAATRTITWLVGEVGPGNGGYADFSVSIRGDAPRGTEINYGTCISRASLKKPGPMP